jgi:hypothetical protein
MASIDCGRVTGCLKSVCVVRMEDKCAQRLRINTRVIVPAPQPEALWVEGSHIIDSNNITIVSSMRIEQVHLHIHHR